MKTHRMISTGIALVLLGSTLLATVAAAQAAPGRRPGGPDRGGPGGPPLGPPPLERLVEEHAEELELDAAALERIDEQALASRRTLRPLREAVREAHDGLRELLDTDGEIDYPKVRAQLEKLSAARLAEEDARIRGLIALRRLLTPEQLRQLREIQDALAPAGPRGFGLPGDGPVRAPAPGGRPGRGE